MYQYNLLPRPVHTSLTSIPIFLPLFLVPPPLPSVPPSVYFPTKTILLLTLLFPSFFLLTWSLFPPKAEIAIKTSYFLYLPERHSHPVIRWNLVSDITYIIPPVNYNFFFFFSTQSLNNA